MSDDATERQEIDAELGDRYQIVRELGRGAFGTVYLARELRLHRLVAVKVLHVDRAWSATERERLLREARTVGQLSHPGIVPLLAFGETESTVYMVMPFVAGESLADRLRRDERLDPREARRILIEIADALAYAHGEGVLHRDLKPENILLERAGAVDDDVPPRVRLIDFGVAAFPTRDAGVRASPETWGTPRFMAPEQALGEPALDPRTELYSFGVLAFLLLGGRLPFDASSITDRIRQQREGPPVALAAIARDAPRDLVEAIEKCLAFEPERRWRRARDLRDALLSGAEAASGAIPMSLVRHRLRPKQPGSRWPWSPRAGRRAAQPSGRGAAAVPDRAPHASRLSRLRSALDTDARFAVRSLRKTPGFTAAVILTLAVGLGATSVIFSAVHALLLRELPVADPGSLVMVQEARRGANQSASFGASTFRYDRYLAYREPAGAVLSGLAAQSAESFSVRLGDQAQSVAGLATSGNYFEVLGLRPALGRFYSASQDEPGGAAPAVVIGYDFWRRALGGDPAAVGRTLFVDSRPLTIVGVAPAGFNGAFIGIFDFDIWVPAAAYQQGPPTSTAAGSGPRYLWVNLFGRLRRGVDPGRASAALRVSGARVPPEDPRTRIEDAWVEPLTALPGEMQGAARSFLVMLLGVAGLVLLIAVTNAAGMLLARGAARAREVATRLAVGASRARIVRQLLVESTLLCVLAGGVGLLLTWWLTGLLNAWQPPFPVPVEFGFGVNGAVLGVVAATVVVAGLLSGLAPALQATKLDLASAMKDGGLQGGPRRTRLRSGFVVAQVALSVVLLTVAGLFVRSLQRTLMVHPGFEAAGVLHAGINLAPHGYDAERGRVLLAQLLERLRARPEIAAASLASSAPLSGNTQTWDARRPDRPEGEEVHAQWGVADVGFVEVLRVPLLAGRTFTAADAPDAPRVAVINETLARRLWPDETVQQVLGREFESLDRRMTVVGVIANGKYTTLQEPERAFGYVPFSQRYSASPLVYLRARGTPAAALRAAREEMAALDPNIALQRPALLTADVARYLIPQRAGAWLIGAFGLVGLVLAATGLYGVLAYGATQRQREFGVRMALGARAADVVRLVVHNGLALVAGGIGLGLLGGFAAGRLVAGFLFGLSPSDPLTLVTVPLILVAVAILASVVPARRAANADPMVSLRAE